MNRRLAVFGGVGALLGGAFALGPRVVVDARGLRPSSVGVDVDTWLRDREASEDVRPDSHARIVWARPDAPARTDVVIVYLHGFSADPFEISPVPERVAAALGANLYQARLTGHGERHPDALGHVRAVTWMQDARDALAVARQLGDRVVLWGTSTGATLATWLAVHDAPDDLHALVMVSPNFGLAHPASRALTWPWGLQLAQLLQGPRRTWTDLASPATRRHWTTDYPTRALVEVAALVDHVVAMDLSRVTVPTLVVYSPDDAIVDEANSLAVVRRFSGPVRLQELTTAEDPAQHVITGDIFSPSTVEAVVGGTTAFLQGVAR